MTRTTATLLDVVDVRAATAAIDAAAPGSRRRLTAAVRDALQGSPHAARSYVRAYGELADKLLAAMHEARPDLVERDEDGRYCVRSQGRCSHAGVELLRDFAADAPFSAWARPRSPGTGVALDLLARVRAIVPGATPLPLPAGAAYPSIPPDSSLLREWVDDVRLELRLGESDLARIQAVFGLSVTELAQLFGVRRQAVGAWLAAGVPTARRAKVATVAAIADILAYRLKHERIPGIVRRAAPAYGGRSMVEVIAADEQEWLLASVRGSFDYSSTA
jgi:hypothetical protein